MTKEGEQRPNLICNFRAPTLDEYLTHKDFVKAVRSQGLDACRVLIGFEQAFLTSLGGKKGEAKFQTPQSVFNISMTNNFNYQVERTKRLPYSLASVKPMFRRTISSSLFDAYVLRKAGQMTREFSYRDFLELEYNSFRRTVRRLKSKGLVIANPSRTNPRFYYLTERLNP
jgi:hypothetical protein